jgi:hypothetical protein
MLTALRSYSPFESINSHAEFSIECKGANSVDLIDRQALLILLQLIIPRSSFVKFLADSSSHFRGRLVLLSLAEGSIGHRISQTLHDFQVKPWGS